MNADQHRKAKYVIAWLAKAIDPDNPDYAIPEVKAQRWSEVCAAVEANRDLSAATIAERLGNRDATPVTNRVTAPQPEPWTPPDTGPPLPRTEVTERIAKAKAALADATKPPIPTTEERSA